jgi:hypothetical protein
LVAGVHPEALVMTSVRSAVRVLVVATIGLSAAQYGFIMVVPSSGRCWDVVSDKTRKRDNYGDSHAIRQMVKIRGQRLQGERRSCLRHR